MTEKPSNNMIFEYRIRFQVEGGSYSIKHYNSPWDNLDRALEDVRIMLDGRDLEDNDFSAYKLVDWKNLEPGMYDLEAEMRLYRFDEAKPHEQSYRKIKLEKVK